MKKLVIIVCAILAGIGVLLLNIPGKPKVISSVAAADTLYLTVLVDCHRNVDKEWLEEKILQMCAEDSFENFKLWTEKKQPEKIYISVYLDPWELKRGNPYITVQYERTAIKHST